MTGLETSMERKKYLSLKRAGFLFTRPLSILGLLMFSLYSQVKGLKVNVLCIFSFVCLVIISFLLMAESAMVHWYQSRSISNRVMTARSSLLTASAEKMLHICVGPIQSHWHLGMLIWHWSRQGVRVWQEKIKLGASQKRQTLEVTTGTN